VTLAQFLSTLRKRWLYLIVPPVLIVLGVGVWSSLTPPLYTARASAYFSLRTGQTASELNQGATYTQQQISSYALLASKPVVLDAVIAELGLQTSARELAQSVTARASVESVIVDVSASAASADSSARLANAVVQQLGQVVQSLSPRVGGQPSVKVTPVAVATPPEFQSSPNTRLNVLVAGLAGLLVGTLAALAREQLDNKIRVDGKPPAGLSLLGTVESDRQPRRQPLHTPGLAASRRQQGVHEAFRRIRTNLRFLDVEFPVNVVVVTSSAVGEGKSTVALNLADALAEDGRRVVLVDADLRRPMIARYLGVDGDVGLVDVLTGKSELEDALQKWSRKDQFVLPAGPLPPNAAELLGSSAMAKLMVELREQFDMVIIDSPPLLPVTDASVLARHADGALVVVRHARTTRHQLDAAIDSLRAVQARILGTVINRVPGPRRRRRRLDGPYTTHIVWDS